MRSQEFTPPVEDEGFRGRHHGSLDGEEQRSVRNGKEGDEEI